MNLEEGEIPDEVDPDDKTGSMVINRFWYQAACAAFHSIFLLDKNSTLDCIYCEYHDDILFRLKNSRFYLVQVKTRDENLNYFQTEDKEILNSIARFMKFERRFPDKCKKFYIYSNQAFWTNDNSFKNFKFLLNENRRRQIDYFRSSSPTLKNMLERLEVKTDRQLNLFKKVLSKTFLLIMPSFNSITFHIAHELSRSLQEEIDRYPELLLLTKNLINECLLFSKQDYYTEDIGLYIFEQDPKHSKLRAIIENRKMTEEKLQQLIKEHSGEEFLLKRHEKVRLSDSSTPMTNLVKKMQKGKVNEMIISITQDLTYSFTYKIFQWKTKYGLKKTEDRLNHICTLISSRCQEVYGEVYNDRNPFGQEMYGKCCIELKNIVNKEDVEIFDLTYDLLKGTMGYITDECLLWWSEQFNVMEA